MGEPWASRGPNVIHLDEDALPRTYIGGLHHLLFETRRDIGQRSRSAGIVEHVSLNCDIGNAVFELHEHFRAVIHTETITCAQILIDPHSHSITVSASASLS